MLKKSSLIISLILTVIFLYYSSIEASLKQEIRYMMKCGDRIYLHTGERDIKIYDVNENKVIKSIELPDRDKAKQNFSVLTAIEDNCTLYMQASPYEFIKSTIYQFKDETITTLGALRPFNRIVAVDGDYFYVNEKLSSKKVVGEGYEYEYWFKGYRYDKQLNKRIENHFNDHPELIMTDIWEDIDKYWYVGFINPYGTHPEMFTGKPFLLSKDKYSRQSALYKFRENDFRFSYNKGIAITGDADSIWMYGSEEDNGEFTSKIFKFSKNKKIIEKEGRPVMKLKNNHTVKPVGWLYPKGSQKERQLMLEDRRRVRKGLYFIKEKTDKETAKYIWLVSHGVDEVFLFDKDAFELTSFASEHEVPPLKNNYGYRAPFLSDENYIWIAIPYYSHNEELDRRGYLVRISKADASYEVLPVFSKSKEIVRWIAIYFLICILILSPVLSIILGFSNISKIKYLKGWKLTAVLIVFAILLVILGPTFENIFDEFAVFSLFAMLILGLAPIFLSRSLTYIVKSTKFKKISWVLAICLSLFSGGLFAALFLITFRFVTGEGGLGLIVVSAWGAPIVSFISLIVNIRERIS